MSGIESYITQVINNLMTSVLALATTFYLGLLSVSYASASVSSSTHLFTHSISTIHTEQRKERNPISNYQFLAQGQNPVGFLPISRHTIFSSPHSFFISPPRLYLYLDPSSIKQGPNQLRLTRLLPF